MLSYYRRSSPVFNGRVYGPLGFTKEDGEGVCFSFYEMEQKIKKHHIYSSSGNRKALKNYLYIRDDGICKYCKTPLSYKESTIDHYYPPEAWHVDDIDEYNRCTNLVLCCYPCNFYKGKKMPDKFIIYDRNDRRFRTIARRKFRKAITNIKLTLNGTKT
jgi:5-methylcytosine-specific restriction endonuclease McrA